MKIINCALAMAVLINIVSVARLSAFTLFHDNIQISDCDAAAAIAAREKSVPLQVLLAVTRTETGRHVAGTTEPWPWALNVEGKSLWLGTKGEALSRLRTELGNGVRSIDIGCFQLNYHWHGMAFSSLEEMLDPVSNARYAASFLADLFAESGDWRKSVGMYHSRSEDYAAKYLSRFETILTGLDDAYRMPGTQAPTRKQNRFPLLRAAQSEAVMGSLVPLSEEPGRRLFSR